MVMIDDGDDGLGVDDVVVGELEFDDKGRALFCEYCGWFGRGRKLQVELTR